MALVRPKNATRREASRLSSEPACPQRGSRLDALAYLGNLLCEFFLKFTALVRDSPLRVRLDRGQLLALLLQSLLDLGVHFLLFTEEFLHLSFHNDRDR